LFSFVSANLAIFVFQHSTQKQMKISTVILFVVFPFAIAAAQPPQPVFKSKGKVNYPLTHDEETMLDTIQRKTFLFFLKEHHPEMGIVKDRTAKWAPASIASTGFGLPAFAIGAERKWITRDQAAQITLRILKFFAGSVQSADTNVTGYKGFYYHFLRMNSGTREWKCELSSIDTGLLMMGIIFARNYYTLDNEVEKQIRLLAAMILGRIDWDFMRMPDSGKFANTISMGWSPENGLHTYGWSGYNEGLFLYVLAAGSGMENAGESYKAWLKSYQWNTPYKGLSHVAFPPLFGHQFSQAFIDYRGIVDEYMKDKGIDYFENSRRATYVQRQYAIDNPKGWIGYDSLCWGVTASDGPTERYNSGDKKFLGYAGRGTSGPDYNYFDDGTIAPYGPLSSLPFAPEIVLPTIKSINKKYGQRLWGKYGYYDSFNPTAKWFNDDFIGIDEGPMLIMIENFRTGLVWNYVMKDPIIQKGLTTLGYKPLTKTLDEFENTTGWTFIKSDGVNLKLSNEKGLTGKAIRFDYDFTKGTGYGGIQKLFPIDLPDNYEFTFYVKAESPANNFEIKFIDSTGNNVWWVNNRNYDFPTEWKKIRIKKRHINFAWGPTTDQSLTRVDRIEFTIASFVGGKGTIWLDDLKFEPLQPETQSYPVPSVTASSSVQSHSPEFMVDHSNVSYWQSREVKDQQVIIDFTTRREFGGLQINWLKGHYAKNFDVLLSEDGQRWEKVYSVQSNRGEVSFIRLPEAEARFVKIDLAQSASDKGFGIGELKFLDIKSSLSLNDFLIYTAKNSPVGNYPRYFLEQASYWTITGVNNDVKEALINEDGMVEAEKARFSIEPMIRIGDSLYNWSNVKSVQSMGLSEDKSEFNFVPSVTWHCQDLKFSTGVTASGEANKNSRLDISYAFANLSGEPKDFEFYLLVRPYQVNPYYQFLNLTGGAGKIHAIKEDGPVVVVDDKVVLFQKKPDFFTAGTFDDGNIVDFIRSGNIPQNKSALDQSGLASGLIKYRFHLNPGERTEFFAVVPFYPEKLTAENPVTENVTQEVDKATEFWKSKTGHIKFNLPASANRIVNTYKSNLAYILINRDKAGIQPGSRSYERSWIRDGALTSSALLKSGIVQEVKEFIEWYTSYQYENGKAPCVVDLRGPDPVPEHDSHGEMIYLIREYFNFTKDTIFLRSKNRNVLKAVEYLESLIAERSTAHFKNGNDSVRAYYGLVTESISHEGYSAKPMHSYWDNFFTMKGLKDAAEIQKILGEKEAYERIAKVRDTFKENLYNSLQLAMKTRKINYIPGCVELGDFDATSTTIALTPCNELNNLPRPQVYNTFEKYYEFFKNRRDGKLNWMNYTPYENRLIGSYIILDQPDRAHELIKFFLDDQRPQGWNHWAEVVWKDYRIPRYIGDMPHTWVGSDFINAIRAMFVYENEYDQSLVLAAALYQDWIDSPAGMSVEHLPTYYGEISYAIKKEGNNYHFSISGDVTLPANGIKIRNFNGSKPPLKVTVNGIESKDFNDKEISVNVMPAEVVIYY
jgi:hypothetical protein